MENFENIPNSVSKDQLSPRQYKKFGDKSQIEKGFRPEDFYSREHVLKDSIKIPKSNRGVLIVPPIFDGWGFVTSAYNKEWCQDIKEETFIETIRKCNNLVQTKYRMRRAIGRGGQTNTSQNLMVMGLSTGILGFILMEYMIQANIETIIWAYVVGILFGMSLLIAIGVFISVFFIKSDMIDNDEKIGRELQQLLETENKITYRNLGYEWATNRDFFWLQLHKTQQRMSRDGTIEPR